MSVLEISLLVIAVAFVVLVLCFCRFLCKTCTTVKQVQKMSENINSKLNQLDPMFRALENCGSEWECKTALHNERFFCKYCQSKHTSEEVSVADCVEFALMGINLWKKYSRGD